MVEYSLDNDFNDSFKQYAFGVSIDSKNQLEEFAKILRSGTQMVEINIASMYGGEGASAEKIGKEERKAISDLANINKVELSVHAPWSLNLSGINPQSGELDPRYKDILRQEIDASLKFVDEISEGMNKKHMPTIFHASNDQFGNPDKENVIFAYDVLENKVVPILKGEIPGMTKQEFLSSSLYGKELEEIKSEEEKKLIENGIHEEKREYEVIDENGNKVIKTEPVLVISPEAGFELRKIQEKEKLAEQIANLDNYIFNIENFQLKSIPIQIQEALQKNDFETVDSLRQQMDSLSKNVEELKTKKAFLEKQMNLNIVPLQRFDEKVVELTAQGIKDAAMHSAFETKTQPMILIENPMNPHMSLSNPEELAKTIQLARELFVKEAMEKKGLSRSEAEALSKELIGINLDTGHLNTFKAYGFKDEDLVNMALKAKDYVKRYHLSDNMGYTDVHLPIGQGTTPTKQIYEEMKKAGIEVPAILEVFGGIGGMDVGIEKSYQYMAQNMNLPVFGSIPYTSLPQYASKPYSGLVGNYSEYSNLNLKNDFFSYGFSGIFPAMGAGYIEENKNRSQFSGVPTF